MGLSFASYTFSSKDVPGRWSLILFLPFCNFRCRHCHNWKIVLGKEKADIGEDKVIYELENNPFIDTLVISGGEPTVHEVEELARFLEKVRKAKPEIGIRIDTNGSKPEVMAEISDLVDGFAVDIKAPLDREDLYAYTCGVEFSTENLLKSIEIADGMPLTLYRTPKYPWLSKKEIVQIEELTEGLKSPWHLNEFFEVHDCPFNL